MTNIMLGGIHCTKRRSNERTSSVGQLSSYREHTQSNQSVLGLVIPIVHKQSWFTRWGEPLGQFPSPIKNGSDNGGTPSTHSSKPLCEGF